jgi:hypothetical protein
MKSQLPYLIRIPRSSHPTPRWPHRRNKDTDKRRKRADLEEGELLEDGEILED